LELTILHLVHSSLFVAFARIRLCFCFLVLLFFLCPAIAFPMSWRGSVCIFSYCGSECGLSTCDLE
jgi:hypothetical protein